ncbi:hypothetical protein [Streptomyces sp. PvR018]|uniref:hypothetical protein n=1 Tax=Streptomyces sp. PvR018 TaxID=3156442 RepID=UPI0033941EB1
MESEVIAALIATPAVLVTAAAAWAAGRAQSYGTYHGTVDAVRRAAQREAYTELYQTARNFRERFDAARRAELGNPPGDPALFTEMYAALDALEHAVNIVSLEGPDRVAEVAERMYGNARRFGGQRFGGSRIVVIDTDSPQGMRNFNEAIDSFDGALADLLLEARRYLNGGPLR